jgi:hypothetical protein
MFHEVEETNNYRQLRRLGVRMMSENSKSSNRCSYIISSFRFSLSLCREKTMLHLKMQSEINENENDCKVHVKSRHQFTGGVFGTHIHTDIS